MGGKVWVDKRVLLRHSGTFVFNHEAQNQIYQDLHKIAMDNQAAGKAPVAAAVDVPAPDMPTKLPDLTADVEELK